MASTTFINGTLTDAAWFNDVNSATYKAASETTSTINRTTIDKFTDTISVKDYGAIGNGIADDTAAFNAAATVSVNESVSIIVPAGSYLLNSDIATAATWILDPNAIISKRAFAAAPGNGGGYLAFNKSRLTADGLYNDEQLDTASYGYGRNILGNPYFQVWERLDVLGGTSVTASRPTWGITNTYSGSGGRRIYGPDLWWGKVWGGAYNVADPVTYAGAGDLLLERKVYGLTGELDSPYYLRATHTGHNNTAGTYTDPVYGAGIDIGTNTVEIARTIRGARRTGKMTFKTRIRWISGDPAIAFRLTYNFGTGGSPDVIVNAQGFTLTQDGNEHDYLVQFEVPTLSTDGYGNPISFGTAGTDYITLSLTGGADDNFSWDVFAIGLWHGWGFMQWEKIPMALNLARCRQEFQYIKVGWAGSTVSGSRFGQIAQTNPEMAQTPVVALASIVFNSGAFTGAPDTFTVTSAGSGYATAPTVTVGNAWVALTAYAVGDMVSVGGRIYNCTIAGTSSATAPTHTVGTAVDGTVTWQYCATVTAAVAAGLITSVTMSAWSGTAGSSGYTLPPPVSFTGGGGSYGAATTNMLAAVFSADKHGFQWWLSSGSTGNNGRVVAFLSADGQLIKF